MPDVPSLDPFLAGPVALRKAVADMTPDQLKARPVPGRWSVLEVVCHLADSEQAWCHRLKRAIAEEKPLLIGYDETRFAAAFRYQERDPASELSLFEATRGQMAGILATLAPDAWQRTAVHNELGLITLADMVRIESEHVFHHLRHVDAKRQALGLAPSLDGAHSGLARDWQTPKPG